jgi:hypothetical protein
MGSPVCTTYTQVSVSHKTPEIFASIPLRSKRLDALPDQPGLGGVFFNYRDRWRPAARKISVRMQLPKWSAWSAIEEAGIPLVSEVLEGTDRDDAVAGP